MATRRLMLDDCGIGKEIDWSLFIPPITRPVWEPPALEVLDEFEELFEDEANFNLRGDTWKAEYPDEEGFSNLGSLPTAVLTTSITTANDNEKVVSFKRVVRRLWCSCLSSDSE